MPFILRKLIRWLDTDISYLTRGGGWTSISQALGILIGLATAYVFANFLPQAAYGTYKYVLAGAAFIAIPALNGMNTAVLQAIAKHADGTARAAMRKRFLFGLIGTVGGLIVSAYYLIQGDLTLGIGFFLAALTVPCIESLTTAQSIPLGKKRIDIAAYQSMGSSLFIAFSVICTVFLTHDPLYIIASYFISTLVARIFSYLGSRKLLENSIISKESLAFGVHTSIAGILGVVANNVDIFVLWHSAGAETLAMYAFALAAVNPFQSLVKSFINLAHAKFAVHAPRELIQSAQRRAGQVFLILIPTVTAIVLVLPFLFHLLFPAYMEAVPYAQVMAASVLFYSEKMYSIALIVAHRSRALYAISAVSTGTRILFFLILIPLFGVWGAVLATVLQQIAAFVTTRIFFSRMAREIESVV